MKKGKNKNQMRQGDVLIEYVDKPIKGTPSKEKRVILAYGEATGHMHEVDSRSAILLDIPQEKDLETRGLRVTKADQATHQEHGPLDLRVGDAIVIRQREYTPQAIRNVAD